MDRIERCAVCGHYRQEYTICPHPKYAGQPVCNEHCRACPNGNIVLNNQVRCKLMDKERSKDERH